MNLKNMKIGETVVAKAKLGLTGKVLWWDERDGKGIIEDAEGNEHYFDTSVLKKGLKPKRGMEVKRNI
jgi:cold shock CspA family protein